MNEGPFLGFDETDGLDPTEERCGITDLFAATNFAAGEVLCCTTRSNKVTYAIALFNSTDLHAPPHLKVDVLLDNPFARNVEPIPTRLAHRRPARQHPHFTPTSSSCLNLLEGRPSPLTQRRPRLGVLTSPDDLLTAIETSPHHCNYHRDSLLRNKPPNEILSRLNRGRSTLASLKSPACRQPRPDTTERSNGDTL
ncbi:MAG: hypothetical protein WAV54_13555 [Acidimicrobiales bacterium]